MTPDSGPTPTPTPARRIGTMVGGYLAAALVAALVVRGAFSVIPEQEISSGMAAFGMALLYLAIFSSLSLAHSVLLLVWLRGTPRRWRLALMALPTALAACLVGLIVLAA